SQQPRCCHKRNDGTECNAHPQTGKQYCFFHDPASQKKSAAARRAGGVLRRRNAQATPQAIPELACLLAKPMREASGVAEFLNEVARQFCQGNIDLRAAAEMRQCAIAVLRTFEFEARNQREAARAAAPRTSSGKKLPFPVQFNVTDILTGELYQSPNQKAHSAAEPLSLGQQDKTPNTKEDKPEQARYQSVSPASAAGAKDQTKDHTEAQVKAQTEAQPPAKAQQPNEQNKPQPNSQNKPQPNDQDEAQPNGHSAPSPAPPAAQPVSPAPKEHQSVHYPPGLGPRYISVATPEMPWWRRPQYNNPGFVTGKVPKTAARPAPRFRGTRR
ncbi:MAG TPA: hypothetical protein VK738_11630, partial [Terriglobales bacterium]|nr:hypothetical protein [Terriglobales bacterium]